MSIDQKGMVSEWEETIQMMRGDTLAFAVQLDGLDTDLDTAYFTIKPNRSGSTIILQKSLGDGITKVDTDLYRVRVAPEDTEDVDPDDYYYDLQIEVNNDRFTIMHGIIQIMQDTTY